MAEESTNSISTLEKMIALSPLPYFGEKSRYKWKLHKNMQDPRKYPGNEAKTEAIMGTFFSRTFIYFFYVILLGNL